MLFGSKSGSFKPEQDMPSLEGKVILVTGGNIGLGKQCVLEYARHGPAEIWLAARNIDKAKAAVDEIKQQLPDAARPPPIRLVEMDLSSLESVKEAARTISASVGRLDILMLNAGIMAAPPGLTRDGHELQFGTNYLGHALLVKLLLPVLEKTVAFPGGADVRLVMLSSDGHSYAPKAAGIQFDSLKTSADSLGPYGRYGQSKLAMILWARRMAQLYPQFTTASIHPGVVQTNLLSSATGTPQIVLMLARAATMLLTPIDQGVRNQLWASVSKEVKSGEYYTPVGVEGLVSAHGKNDDLAKQLWDWTEKELGGYSL